MQVWTDNDFATMEQMRREGCEWEEIGARFGKSGNAARKAFAPWKQRNARGESAAENEAAPSKPTIKPMPAVPSAPVGDAPQMPPSFLREYKPFQIDDSGSWLILSDIHIPYHEPAALVAAIETGQRLNVTGVILNGDTLDSHELSRFDKDPTVPRYRAEREACLQFFAYLRYRMPKARIIWKDGNHEERFYSYLMQRAEAFFGMEEFTLPNLLKMDNFGIEPVGDKRVIRIGKFNLVHGHEYRPNIQAPVNPARGLFLRAKGSAMCGHFHQTSEHHEPTITGKPIGCWSTGCLCQLNPSYMPLNRHNHGFAVIDVIRDGNFSVRNFRIMDGEVL